MLAVCSDNERVNVSQSGSREGAGLAGFVHQRSTSRVQLQQFLPLMLKILDVSIFYAVKQLNQPASVSNGEQHRAR